MKKFLIPFLVLLTSMFGGTAIDIQGLYYSGINSGYGLLSGGALDPHWSVTYANVNGISGNSAYMGAAYVVSPNFIDSGWVQNTTSAQWIVAPGASTTAAGTLLNTGGDYLPGNGTSGQNTSTFIYTLHFTIIGTGTIGSTITNNVSINLTMAADDQYQVYVNPTNRANGSINTNSSTQAGNFASAWNNTSMLTIQNFTAAANASFVLGDNTIQVVVENTNSINGKSNSTAWNPSGFLLYQQYGAATIDGRVVPEPSSYGCIFLLLAGSVILFRRLKNQRTL